MLCPSCESDIPPDSQFCNRCGVRLDSSEAETLRTSEVIVAIADSSATPPADPPLQPRVVSSDFVGRQREMGELMSALDDAMSGRGQAL